MTNKKSSGTPIVNTSTNLSEDNGSPASIDIGLSVKGGDNSLRVSYNDKLGQWAVTGEAGTPFVTVQVQLNHSENSSGGSVDLSRGVGIGSSDTASVNASAHVNASYERTVTFDEKTGITTIKTTWNSGLDAKGELTLVHNKVSGTIEVIDVTRTRIVKEDINGEPISDIDYLEFDSDVADVVYEVAEAVDDTIDDIRAEANRPTPQDISEMRGRQMLEDAGGPFGRTRLIGDGPESVNNSNPDLPSGNGSAFGDAEINQSLSSLDGRHAG